MEYRATVCINVIKNIGVEDYKQETENIKGK
jgi:hypothetical protein